MLDDYGHHPTEIKATLSVLRTYAGARRTVVVFQPHRYSRTQALWDDFLAAFAGADVLLLVDIYAASEDAIPGVDAERLAGAIPGALYAGDVQAAGERLIQLVKSGDVVLTLGAGNVFAAGEALLRRLEERA